ncbi:hypothetical protein BX600DRAFT_519920 [Xylariales sp. PMI_506]|nr:hypothetical protein BX600DRAFT_519920 [Xylariales sp. PMI_506]
MTVEIATPPSPVATEESSSGAVSSFDSLIQSTIDGLDADLQGINKKIWENPELGFEEFQAHDNIVALLRKHGHNVTEHAFGIETSMQAEFGTGGRVVTFNAEYDSLPGIGHACGHNLIATASVGAYLAVAEALRASGKPGRVRLLGTPAEEGQGGKVKLVDAGAYDDVDACLMLHPGSDSRHHGRRGTSYAHTLANEKVRVRFRGAAAHASMYPWQGINALDAVALTYSAVSMLRQQIRPGERIHCIVSDGGKAPNVIPDAAEMVYVIRSGTRKEAAALRHRVERCFEGAAIATGCAHEVEDLLNYADMRPNKTICTLWADAMSGLGSEVNCDLTSQVPGMGSTDMGNVSYVCPGFHGFFGIPTAEGEGNHTAGFTKWAGTPVAHERTIVCSKGIAIAGWRILESEDVAKRVWEDFDKDDATEKRTATA